MAKKNNKLPPTNPEETKLLRNGELMAKKLETFIQEIQRSNQWFPIRVIKSATADYARQSIIVKNAAARIDGNFQPLLEIKDQLVPALEGLSSKIEQLQKANKGRPLLDDKGIINDFLKRTQSPINQLNMATKVVPVDGYGAMIKNPIATGIPENNSVSLTENQIAFIDRLAVELASKLGTVSVSPDVKKDKEEEKKQTKKTNAVFDKILTWIGYNKAKEAINNTRKEMDKNPSIIGKVLKKTGSIAKNVFDHILDLPEYVAGFAGKLIMGLMSGLSTALSIGLFLAGKVFRSRIGMAITVASLLFTDKFRDLIYEGVKKAFGEGNADQISNAFKNIPWEGAITGAILGKKFGIWGMVAGALLGAVGEILVKDIQETTYDSVKEQISQLKEKKTTIESALKAATDKVAHFQKELDDTIYEKDSIYRSYLEKELAIATASRDSLLDKKVAIDRMEAMAKSDAELLKNGGWMEKTYVSIMQGTDRLMNWITTQLTPFESTKEMRAFTERKFEEFNTNMENKANEWKKQIHELVLLPFTLLDNMVKWLDKKTTEFKGFIYDKSGGLFGEKISATGLLTTGKPGAAVGSIVGSIIRDEGKKDKVTALEMQSEMLREQERAKAMSFINAPTTNSRSNVSQTNNNSTVQLRVSPTDQRFQNRAF